MVSIADLVQLDTRTFKDPLNGYAPMTKDAFKKMSEIVGKNIAIFDIQEINNQYGKGASFAFVLDGKAYYTITHGQVITDVLLNPDVLKSVEEGEPVECRFVLAKSKSDASRKLYKMIAPDDPSE